MRELNKEKVKMLSEGKVAVEFDKEKDEVDDLRMVLGTAFPEYVSTIYGTEKYYYLSVIGCWGCSKIIPNRFPTHPLSWFYTHAIPCKHCKGTGSISVKTIEEIAKEVRDEHDFSLRCAIGFAVEVHNRFMNQQKQQIDN